MYDATGLLYGFRYNNVVYYYDRDILGNINSFRYKGYYYDVETGLYYLMTRYYNPLWGRFISPDNVKYLNAKSINGLNLYAYCMNNPIMYADPSGCVAWWVMDIFYISASIVCQSAKAIAELKSGKFNLFGYELRTSAGWNTSPDIATSFLEELDFLLMLQKHKDDLECYTLLQEVHLI